MWLLYRLSASKLFKPALTLLAALVVAGGLFWAGTAWNERGHAIEKLQKVIEAKDRKDEIKTIIDSRDDDALACGLLPTCD